MPSEPTTKAVMDFPSAWEFVRNTDPADHATRCSWRSTSGAFLCDCSVVWIEYGRRDARVDADATIAALRKVLADEPVLQGDGLVAAVRWYSEGWNRLRRDIEAVLTDTASPAKEGNHAE